MPKLIITIVYLLKSSVYKLTETLTYSHSYYTQYIILFLHKKGRFRCSMSIKVYKT